MAEKPPLRRIPLKKTLQARELRGAAPIPERFLWSRLRNGQVGGVRFRRQHVVGPYIADFYCAAAKLVIELDGRSHDRREEHDARRTRYMEAERLRVIRFSDDQVARHLDVVVDTIAREIGLPW